MAKHLTEQQEAFLDALFGEAKGNPTLAKKMAGYSDNKAASVIINSLKDEILERTKIYLATHAPKAAMSVVDGMHDPTELGFKEKLAAAKDLLDRVGIIKTEKVMVESSPGIIVLPPKGE